METTREQDGLSVQKYPVALTTGELRALLAFAKGRSGELSPKLSRWFIELVDNELQRRATSEDGEPIEPAMPRLDCTHWSDGELGDALVAMRTMLQTYGDRPKLMALLWRLDQILTSWLRYRLRRR